MHLCYVSGARRGGLRAAKRPATARRFCAGDAAAEANCKECKYILGFNVVPRRGSFDYPNFVTYV